MEIKVIGAGCKECDTLYANTLEAAKELILKTDVPHIVNRGRKGGSNVAAAIVNALLYQIRPV